MIAPDDRSPERDRAEPTPADDDREQWGEMIGAAEWEDRAVPNLADFEAA